MPNPPFFRCRSRTSRGTPSPIEWHPPALGLNSNADYDLICHLMACTLTTFALHPLYKAWRQGQEPRWKCFGGRSKGDEGWKGLQTSFSLAVEWIGYCVAVKVCMNWEDGLFEKMGRWAIAWRNWCDLRCEGLRSTASRWSWRRSRDCSGCSSRALSLPHLIFSAQRYCSNAWWPWFMSQTGLSWALCWHFGLI